MSAADDDKPRVVSATEATAAGSVIDPGDDTMPAAAGATYGEPPQLPDVEPSTYELREQLGAGGMGKVVVARDRRLGRLLAIKVSQTQDRSMRVRFTREAVLTARLQHPSIIPVHEAGLWAGEPFYAMKLVAGHSLARLIARTRTLDQRLALIPNVIAVVDALAYAHAQRVIHRDLKPDNVIVGEYGETIVIDWGLAKELDREDDEEEGGASAGAPYRRFDAGQTVEGAAMGTPPYMAPEQAAGERVDERADVYGLGAMLYHVLCGAPPYAGATADEVMERVLAGPPVALAARQDGIPADLLAIVDKAMARDPLERYANAKQLAEDLKRFETGQLVAAHAYSRRELIRRWVVRHRTAIAVGGAALVAIALAITFWVRAELRAGRERLDRVAELLRADDTDAAVARAQLASGDFAAAAATLERQVARLDGKGTDRFAERSTERDRVKRVAEFYRHARAATFLTGDEDHGPEAIEELRAALTQLGALDAHGAFVTTPWWENMFPNELTAAQRRDMQEEAYRQILLLGLMHFKAGGLLVKLKLMFIQKSPEAAAHFRTSLEVLAQSSHLERALGIKPARVARIWQEMTLYFLKNVGTDDDAKLTGPLDDTPPEPGRAENAVDYGYLGAGHFFVWQAQDTAIGKALRFTFPEAFDYVHPLETAERLLRTAIIVEPRQYWPYFMLAWALRSGGDFRGAELAADTCVMLAPDNVLGYAQRAQALAERARKETDPAQHDELMARALADSDATVAKQPSYPPTYWARGELMRVLGRTQDSVAAYTRAVELENDMLRKFSRQVGIAEVTTYVTNELPPDDPDALVLLAFLALADHDTGLARAGELATKALALRPDLSRALAIRGTVSLETGKLDLARTDFDAALARAPGNYLAAIGRAAVRAKTAPPGDALAAYDAALAVAETPDHQVAAQVGRYRALVALGRRADADAALAAARAINPARPIEP